MESIKDEDEKKVTINTVQHSVFVARIAIPRGRNYNWFIPYDIDNLYPNKIKTIAERSVTTSSAILTHADFLSGQGFGEGINEIIINEDGTTLEEILKDKSNDFATFRGLALHFNFNRMGQIAEINEIPFENLRWSKEMHLLYYADCWQNVGHIRQVIEYNLFNPNTVIDEINAVGIENYKGQVLYYIPKKRAIYTVCRFDAAVNDAQFEDESSIYKLAGIQNDYAIGGIIKLPAPLFDDKSAEDTIKGLRRHKGSKNASSWSLIPVTNEEIYKGRLFEPMVRQNVDTLFVNQNSAAESNIYKSYQQPPVLNGVSSDGMFNQDQFVDAFDYYNSKTQDERDSLEKVFNRFWPFTVWYNNEKLKIVPKDYIKKRDQPQPITTNTEDL